MSSSFKNARVSPVPSISSGFATAYTCPVGKTAVIIFGQVSNIEASQVGVSIRWTDASAGGAITYLTDEVQVPGAAALGPFANGKLVLEAGDSIQVGQEGTPLNALSFTLGIMELPA